MDALIIVGMGIFVIVVVFIVTMMALNPCFLDGFFQDLSTWVSVICGVIVPLIFFSLSLHNFIEKIDPNSPNIINELNKQDLIFTIIFFVLFAANLLIPRRN